MVTKTELLDLVAKLTKAAETATDHPRAIALLSHLASHPPTLDVLLASKAGKAVKKLAKHSSPEISAGAKRVVDEWMKVVQAASAAASAKKKDDPEEEDQKPNDPRRNDGTSLPDALASPLTSSTVSRGPQDPHATSPKPSTSNPAPTGTPSRVSVLSSSPPSSQPTQPTQQTQQTQPTPDSSPGPGGRGGPPPPTPPPAGPAGATSTFTTTTSTVLSTGNSKRDKVREKLAEALAVPVPDLSMTPSHIATMAAAVEQAMLDMTGSANDRAYLDKYRALAYNVRDPANHALRKDVLEGLVLPAELVGMRAEDLANSQTREMFTQMRKERLNAELQVAPAQVTTDEFKCGKCGLRECTFYQKQTRSADEPMTTFITCVKCGFKWREC